MKKKTSAEIGNERVQLREAIPPGYCTVIAKRANVNKSVVSNFFAGKNNSYKVHIATLEILAELKLREKKLLKIINS